MDGEKPHGVAVLLLGHGLQLPCADGLLLAHEAHEALDVAAAQLLVGAGEPGELAHVRVAAPAVPAGEHGQVVVVVGDDPLAELLEREPVRGLAEPLVALEEGAAEVPVALREVGREPALEGLEERPPRGGGAQEHERIVRQPDERRGEHGDERLVVVAVVQEPQVREQVDDLLLAEVPAARRAVRAQARRAQLLLVVLGVGPGREEEHDLAGGRLARVDELLHARGDVPRLGAPPVDRRPRVGGLVRDEQLDRRAEDRVGEAPGGLERLELVPELAREQVVDGGEHLRPGAVVLREGEHAAGALAALAEDLDVCMPEPVDGLELVADEEELLAVGPLREQVDDLALEPVRVLELVDHDRAEAPALALAHGSVVPQQVARRELEVLEVERGLAVLARAVRLAEAVEQLLEQVAVTGGELVEGRLLDAAPRFLVADRPLAARLQLAEVEQPLGERALREQLERASRRGPGRLASVRVVHEALGRVLQLGDPLGQPWTLAELEHERPTRGTQRLVHAGQHAAQGARAVGGEQPETLGVAVGAELRERRLESLALEDPRLRLVEHPEARVDPRSKRDAP